RVLEEIADRTGIEGPDDSVPVGEGGEHHDPRLGPSLENRARGAGRIRHLLVVSPIVRRPASAPARRRSAAGPRRGRPAAGYRPGRGRADPYVLPGSRPR